MEEGRGYSVDLLGEATVSEREADLYGNSVRAALEELSAASAAWPSDRDWNETIWDLFLGRSSR